MANGKDLVKSDPGSAGTGGGGTGGSGTGGSGGSGGSGSGSGKGGSKGSQAGSSGDGGSGGSGGDSGGGGSSESVGGSGRTSGGGSGSVVGRLRNLGKARSTAVGRVGGNDKEGGEKGSGAPQISAAGSRSSSDGLKAPRTKMNFQMDGEQYQRSESAAVTPTTASASTVSKTGENGDALRPRKAAENTDRKPASKLNEDKGGGLEFGRLFRMFIIFGIIVGIVVFLGGQVLQISKSGEK
jgi:hypothetical protein